MPPHITRLLRASSTPELHTSTSLHLHRASRPSYLHVATPSSSLQALIPPRRYTFIEPPDLHTSLSLHRHRASRPPYLHVATPSSSLQTSIILQLHVVKSGSVRVRAVALLPHQNFPFPASKPNPQHLQHLQHTLRVSSPPVLHISTPVTSLQTSRHPSTTS